MDTLIKADVFFFITSIFVIILTIVLVVASVYVIRALKNFADISDLLKDTAEQTHAELADMIQCVEESPAFSFLFGRRHRRKQRDEEKKSR
jgi:hypothetical protein